MWWQNQLEFSSGVGFAQIQRLNRYCAPILKGMCGRNTIRLQIRGPLNHNKFLDYNKIFLNLWVEMRQYCAW